MQRIAIIGLGVLGGSVARAVKKRFQNAVITAFDPNSSDLEKALAEKVIDRRIDYSEIHPADYDITVVATPVAVSIDIIKELCSQRRSVGDSLVIDVGSVKGFVQNEISPLENSSVFIGCHPMAGSEKAGFENSSSEIFEGASVIITPHRNNSDNALQKIRSLWEKLGARILEMNPLLHDEVVSYTSHLPHLIACSIVETLSKYLKKTDAADNEKYLIGNGFMDTTRVASGSPELWRDILMLNRGNLCRSLSEYIEGLQELRDMLEKNESEDSLEDYLHKVKIYRDRLK